MRKYTWCLVIFFAFSIYDVTSYRERRNVSVASTTPATDEDDDDWDEQESSEIDDDGKVYKNPRNSPSTLCPRDEEQATLLGQKCLRKCSSDEDCKSKKKKCLCDGSCGLSCIKPDRECPEPEQIAYGTVTASGKLFGARATYTCQHGYHVVGLQSRTCQANGQWAGSSPACKQNIYCLSPPTIDHARHNAPAEQATFDLDSTLQYYCHTGYVTNGFPRAKCLAIDGQASWYGPDIACEPRSCGAPTDISHGWHAGECYTYGCRITYHCAEGYELVGKNERYCQADGAWNPKELPTCVRRCCIVVTAVQCPPPDNPRHGKAIYTSCSYNSVVSYECKYGYTLVGESTRRCGADKKWSGSQPVCKEINCGHPGRLWNGWLENIEAGTGLGASIIFRCHDGMLLEGNSSTVCQIEGKWRYPLPKCLAPCVVPHVTQGSVILIGKNETALTSTVVQHGEALSVDCDPHYEFLASLSPVTCNNGTWTSMPKCDPARCKRLPSVPRNGMVIAPKMEHGMKARFKCKDGFELKGDDLMECSFGNWTGELPKCEEVYCPYPGNVQNGKILLVGNMGLYDYRPYVRKVTNNKQIMYDCDKGYVLAEGPPGATCIGGHWSPKELPLCLLGQHPRIRWNRRKRSAIMEKYKRAFIRNYKLIYEKRDKRYVHNYLHLAEERVNRSLPARKSLSERITGAFRQLSKIRRKRALKGGSGSRALGTSHRGSSSSLNLRRGNKKNPYEEEEDDKPINQVVEPKKPKQPKNKGPCKPLSTEPYVNVEVVKHGKDPNVTFSAGTVVKMACGKGYGLNMPENKTAKCVRGKWRPTQPMCLICELEPKIPNCSPGPGGSKVETQYLGGSDIVKGGEITVIQYGNSGGNACGPPAKVRGSLIYRNGQPIVEDDNNFPDGSEVTFNCIESIMGEKTTWKIICEDGSWIGRSLNCDADDVVGAQIPSNNSTCIFRNQEPNVISFFNDQQIREDVVEFPAGAVLISRCIDIGKFAMIGPNKRRCMGGEWDGVKPACFGLNQANDYSMEKPPTILFRHQLGPIAQSNEGKLIVYPGTILHMECLWIRRFGNPKWTVSHDYRKYPEGWSTDPGRDSQLEYRLSIFHASKDDSGLFTCVTPARYTHSVEIEVKAIHCPVVPQRRGLTVNTQSTKMNTKLKFSCINGNALIGAPEVVCLPSGNWSAPFPICESIECGEVGVVLSEHLKVLVVSREVGGRAIFSCEPGFGLRGSSETICQSSGDWATPFPTCEEVHCDNPNAPENGYIQGSGPYKAGDVVQINCNPDYMMEGQPIIACQENSRWSGKMPKCVQACSYPGTTISGRMSSVKFFYKIGENITFTCEEGLQLKGAAMLKCLKNGKWSNTIPTCLPENSDTPKQISVL
ncbi:sushi, von Willebrand factor type A, EGF and pentraxin domain-containing protein 1 isoform X9 [Diorhabda carinulata]|uniref:sushi, von Willebrand factor type A, EGF and pentraxin domain-containing protein 1 isoform X9 n=1 Tax=Diorhabda carinulata TaxID=1163345 RepID=UPI0025A0E340|nr:sushi, von Willebrand factor type A, EGF and pentraxin domain-containing protein 1 isoform X9 [Diorhabda carinulata]